MDEKLFRENLQAYIHGELDADLSVQVKQKIEDDPLCRLEYEKELRFDKLIGKHMIKVEAPYELREQVVANLEKKGRFSWLPQFDFNFSLLGRFATVGFVAIICVAFLTSTTDAFPIFKSSIERHIDCLGGRYSAEVQTSDLQEVTKWFEGRLSFSVRPPDLSDKGAVLKGARLCHLKHKPVALLFYEKDGHRLSVYMIDSSDMKFTKGKDVSVGDKKLYVKSEQGFSSLLCLTKKHLGVGCVVVTDLPEKDLIALMS